MRIAISGTHFSGKSTLVAALERQLPQYTSIEEPYFLLEAEGVAFSHPPTLEDFEKLLERSITAIKESSEYTIFDRCPLDCLAYMLALKKDLDLELWLDKVKEAVQQLDLIVFLPLEERIPVPDDEDKRLRQKVDELLAEIILEDSLGVLENVTVLEITGSLEKRIESIKAYHESSS